MALEFVITLLVALAFNSLIVYGIYTAFYFEYGRPGEAIDNEGNQSFVKTYGEGHIFGAIHFKLESLFGQTILKPFISCPVCMASFHGFWFYWFTIQHFTEGIGVLGNAVFWVLYTLALAGLNSIIYARNFTE